MASSYTLLISTDKYTKQSVLNSRCLNNGPSFEYTLQGADVVWLVLMAVVLDDLSHGGWDDELKSSLAREDGNYFLCVWAPHIVRNSVFLHTLQFNLH